MLSAEQLRGRTQQLLALVPGLRLGAPGAKHADVVR